MLAVALNHTGAIADNNFAFGFLKKFDGFQVLKLNYCDNFTDKQLQLCQPEKEEAQVKEKLGRLDLSKPLLELRGTRDKLQRIVRSMFFPGGEKKYEKILLTGCDGMADFPWAVQVVLVQPPAPGRGQGLEWVRRADAVVMQGLAEEEGRRFADGVRTFRPHMPVFSEKAAGDLSQGLTDCLEDLFSSYLEKREKIKVMLEEQQTGPLMIDCEQARRLAGSLGVNLALVGSVCDESGYRVTRCGLGCF